MVPPYVMRLFIYKTTWGRWDVRVYEDGLHIDTFHGHASREEALGAVAREYPDATETEDEDEEE